MNGGWPPLLCVQRSLKTGGAGGGKKMDFYLENSEDSVFISELKFKMKNFTETLSRRQSRYSLELQCRSVRRY